MKANSPQTHEIKCYAQWYTELRSRRKRFEVRVNDRDYHEGDTLVVNEFYPCTACGGSGLQPFDTADHLNEPCFTCDGKTGQLSGFHHTEIIARVWKGLPGLLPNYVVLALD